MEGEIGTNLKNMCPLLADAVRKMAVLLYMLLQDLGSLEAVFTSGSAALGEEFFCQSSGGNTVV